ncbi:MAG: Phosphoheptose isomerase, partial [uncultured Ramlibacter sp.]
ARTTDPAALHRQCRPEVPGGADAVQADCRRGPGRAGLRHQRRQGAGLRQWRLRGRRAAFLGRVRRALRARTAGAGRHRADHRHLDPHGHRQRLRFPAHLFQAGPRARPGGRRAAGAFDQRQLGQRDRRHRGRARARHERGGAHRPRRRQDRPAAARDRRPHLRAARAHRPHPGSPHPRAALHLRRCRRPAAGRTGTPSM